MKFDINDEVKIRLTDYGRKILKSKKYLALINEDKNGWSEWQLWLLMDIFGGYLFKSEIPFEATIDIPISSLK